MGALIGRERAKGASGKIPEKPGKISENRESPDNWAVIWGVQNVWGEENLPENALLRKFLDPSTRASVLLCRGCLYRKNGALIGG